MSLYRQIGFILFVVCPFVCLSVCLSQNCIIVFTFHILCRILFKLSKDIVCGRFYNLSIWCHLIKGQVYRVMVTLIMIRLTSKMPTLLCIILKLGIRVVHVACDEFYILSNVKGIRLNIKVTDIIAAAGVFVLY